ncbi:glycosyltransferase, partial [Patescibacteria group bacterium]|nr:glycosyltransferase [Patescibacteria group bacterium]
LEAMACGTPVVVSKTNALVEVAGDVALIANPESPKVVVQKITEILKNPSTSLRTSSSTKECLSEKGLEQVKKYSWEKTAKIQ